MTLGELYFRLVLMHLVLIETLAPNRLGLHRRGYYGQGLRGARASET